MARKMILVPEEVYRRMNSQPQIELNESSEVGPVLNNEKLNKSQKLELYNHILQRKINKSKKKKTVKKVKKKDWYSEIAITIPDSHLKPAIALYKWITNNTDIEWSTNGELMYNSRPVTGSNIMDIFHESAKAYKSKPKHVIVGIDEFYELLAKENVLQILIKNKFHFITSVYNTPNKSTPNFNQPPVLKPEVPDFLPQGPESMAGNGLRNWIMLK